MIQRSLAPKTILTALAILTGWAPGASLLAQSPPASHEGHFDAAGLEDADFMAFLARFQEAVARTNIAGVAELVHYPLRVNGPDATRWIDGVQQFRAEYEVLFPAEARRLITEAVAHTLHVSWRGVMFGGGAIWVGGVCTDDTVSDCPIGITALNLEG